MFPKRQGCSARCGQARRRFPDVALIVAGDRDLPGDHAALADGHPVESRVQRARPHAVHRIPQGDEGTLPVGE